MSIVLLSADLMFASKVAGTASQLGIPCATAMSTAALTDQLVTGTRIVVLDLTTPALDPKTLVPKIRSSLPRPPRIIAFGPHVQGELLEEATAAGCDQVLTRGEFNARMADMLGNHATVDE